MNNLYKITSKDIFNLKNSELIDIILFCNKTNNLSFLDKYVKLELPYFFKSEFKSKPKSDKKFFQFCHFYLNDETVLRSNKDCITIENFIHLLSFKPKTKRGKDIYFRLHSLAYFYFLDEDETKSILINDILDKIDKYFTNKYNYKISF